MIPTHRSRRTTWSDANYDQVDLHRPYVDEIVLLSPVGSQ